MSKWKVLVSESARKEFYDLDKDTQQRLRKSFCELGKNPFTSRPRADIKKLKGSFKPTLYRMRAGNYRIIYAASDSEVRITRIIRREKGYGWL